MTAALRVTVGQQRALSGDHAVTGQHELEPAGDRGAVDRRDHRCRVALDRTHQILRIIEQPLETGRVTEHAHVVREIRTGAKDSAHTGDLQLRGPRRCGPGRGPDISPTMRSGSIAFILSGRCNGSQTVAPRTLCPTAVVDAVDVVSVIPASNPTYESGCCATVPSCRSCVYPTKVSTTRA